MHKIQRGIVLASVSTLALTAGLIQIPIYAADSGVNTVSIKNTKQPPFIVESPAYSEQGSAPVIESIPVSSVVSGIDTTGWLIEREAGDGEYFYEITIAEDAPLWDTLKVDDAEGTRTICELYINNEDAGLSADRRLFERRTCKPRDSGSSRILLRESGVYEIKSKTVVTQTETFDGGSATEYGDTIPGSEKTPATFKIDIPSETPAPWAESPCIIKGGNITFIKKTKLGTTYKGTVKHKGNCNSKTGYVTLDEYGFYDVKQTKHTNKTTSFTATRILGAELEKNSYVFVSFTPKNTATKSSTATLKVKSN